MNSSDVHLDDQIRSVRNRLREEFLSVHPDQIDVAVDSARAQVAGATVSTFVPVLVEKAARDHLIDAVRRATNP